MGVIFWKSERNADEHGRRLPPGAVKTQCTSPLFGKIVLTRMSKVARDDEKLTFSRRIFEVESFVSTDVILTFVSADSCIATNGTLLTHQANFEHPRSPFLPLIDSHFFSSFAPECRHPSHVMLSTSTHYSPRCLFQDSHPSVLQPEHSPTT